MWSRTWVLTLLLAVATLIVYARLYDANFVDLDDHEHITFNKHLNPPSWSGVAAFWTGPYFGLYAPVAYTFLSSEAWLAQRTDAEGNRTFNPRVFHTGNVALHALCIVLVFAVLRRLINDQVAAFLGALLFALHPLQVETVAWVSEFRGLLCAVFALLTVYEYLRFLGPVEMADETPSSNDLATLTQSPRRWVHYALACVTYLLALLAKPSAVSVPLILFALEVIYYRRSVWPAIGKLAWWCVPALLLAAWTRQLQDENIVQQAFVPLWWQRPFIALDAITFYLWKLFAPVGLAFDHGRTPQRVLSEWWVYFNWLVPVALVALLAWLPARRVWLTVAAIFVAAILPVAGFVPFTFQDISTVADRYVYLAMLGPALAVAWLMSRTPWMRWRGELALLLAVLAGLTVYQTGFWRDNITLFTRGLDVNPDSTLCLTGVATTRAEQGELDTVEPLLLRVVELNPKHPTVWKNLAALYVRQERFDEAERVLVHAVEIHGDKPEPRLDLALLYFQRQQYQRVIPLLQEVLQVQPDNLEVHSGLAVALVNCARHAEAIEHWQVVVRDDPQNTSARQMLGESLAKTGQFSAALEHLRAVVELQPDNQRAKDYIRLIEAQPKTDGESSP